MVEYVDYTEISNLKDKDYFIIEFNFHDAYVPTHGSYKVIHAKLPFDNSDQIGDADKGIRLPDKRRVVDLLKDIIADQKLLPLHKEIDNPISYFNVYSIIYHYNYTKDISSMLASTSLTCIPNGKLGYDPTNKKSYIVKSNNKIIDRDNQVRKPVEDNVEDYGEE